MNKLLCCFPCFSKNDILDETNIPWLSLEGQFLKCKVIDIYDADTVTLIIPFMGKPWKEKCRLIGIDSAELRTQNIKEKELALKGKTWLIGEILNQKVWVKCGGWDKYGRLLGTIYKQNKDKVSINELLITNGYAYTYDGKKKKKFEEWNNI
jgi:micrococcal nuclease